MPWERKNKDTKADEQVNRLLKEDRSDVNMAHGTSQTGMMLPVFCDSERAITIPQEQCRHTANTLIAEIEGCEHDSKTLMQLLGHQGTPHAPQTSKHSSTVVHHNCY